MPQTKKIWKDPLGFGGILIIIIVALAALFSYYLAPNDEPNANAMQLSLANRPPGFEYTLLRIPREEAPQKRNWWLKLWYGQPSPYQAIPVTVVRVQTDTVFYRKFPLKEGPLQKVATAQFGDKGFLRDQHLQKKSFLLGSDRFGRDLLSRLLLGARVSISVGLVAVLISLLIGIPLGLLAGYHGGRIDQFIMWFINVIWSIPGLLMVIAISLALGKGFWQVFVAIGFTMWVEVARVVRGQVLSLREKEFVQAARVLGYSDGRIMFRHVFPNVVAPLIVISAANFAAAILVESGLSFLGIGVQPPVPSWGGMIKDHYSYLVVGKAYLALAPGFAIMLLVLAFMMVGNALRDVLDVRQV